MAASEKNMAAKKLQKSYFDVLGLCCSSEVPLIENILKPLDGVKDVSVIVPSRTVIVVHDSLLISQIQIVKALNQARLEANVRLNGEVNYRKKWPSPYAIICGLLLALSLFKFIYHPFKWLALGAVGVGIFPIARRGVVAIQNFRLDINILALIAVVGTCFLQDFLEAGTIVFLFTIAEWLESRASHKATAVMSSLMNMAPQKAVIADTGEVVDADEVKVNTVLAVKAGETIPIDGVVVEGNCEVDEKTLTGESFPVPKQKDSTVLAGTINLNGYISVKTTALAEDCVVARMAKLVEEAQNNKSSVQRFIDKCAKYYTPVVLCISIGFVVIPAGLRLHNEKYWFHLALVVLVSGCPCALVLSTPVATFCALSMAATSGILIKGGDYLEILAKIKIMAFDKTGTITRGEFVVTDFRSLHDDISLNTLLYWVSSIEGKSSHPMATALVEYGRSQSVEPKPEIVEEFQNFPGEGIGGKIDGRDIYVGNRRIAQRAGCETVPTLEGDGGAGKTNGYIYCGTTPAGTFSLSDACRSGVMEAIRELKSLGIKTAMLTGDGNAAAMHAQEQLGNALELVHAELLPEDKARIIEGFKKEGPTAMVGDGMNDAPALATADIGISMGISGSALATETGHVILMSNDIRKIPKAIRLARRSHRKVIENVIISITTKSAILALAFAGHPLVWAAVLADVGTCVLVICNSMLLLRGTHKHGGKCCKSSSTLLVNKHGCNGGSCQSSNVHQHSHCDNEDNEMSEPKKCSSQKHGGECCKSLSTLFVNKHICNGGSCQSSLVHRHLHCDNEDNEMSEPKKCSSQKHGGECCKSSSTLVVNKHGSNGGSCQSSHVHRHPHCDNEDNEMSEPKKCSSQKCAPNCHSPPLSSSSCENKRCSESAEGTAISSSCGRVKCKNSVEKQDGCIRSSVLLNSDHCNHGCSEKNGHEMVSEHDHHLNHEQSSSGLGQETRNNGHSCHEKDQHCDGHGFSESRKICCESKGEPAAMHACPSLEKREIGGCCKSLRKDCCAKDRHFGTSLSEIVVE